MTTLFFQRGDGRLFSTDVPDEVAALPIVGIGALAECGSPTLKIDFGAGALRCEAGHAHALPIRFRCTMSERFTGAGMSERVRAGDRFETERWAYREVSDEERDEILFREGIQ